MGFFINCRLNTLSKCMALRCNTNYIVEKLVHKHVMPTFCSQYFVLLPTQCTLRYGIGFRKKIC